MKMAMLQKFFISLVIVIGAVMMGLVTYSYFFAGKAPRSPGELRAESVANTNKLVLLFSQGYFIDKAADVNRELSAPLPGYRAPDFTLLDLNGNEVALRSFRGRPVLVNFWATWCPPCRKEMPDLQAFHEKYGDKVALIGINWGEDKNEVEDFLKKFGITYPNLLDANGKIFALYRLTGLPSSFWIDEEGIIRGVWLGAMKTQDIIAGFQKTTRALEK